MNKSGAYIFVGFGSVAHMTLVTISHLRFMKCLLLVVYWRDVKTADSWHYQPLGLISGVVECV
jgi:homospermidine synthase